MRLSLVLRARHSNPEVDPESGHYSTRPWYLAATCLVSASPEEHRKIGFSGRRLHAPFYELPDMWQSLVECRLRPRNTGKLDSLGDDFTHLSTSSLICGSHLLSVGFARGTQENWIVWEMSGVYSGYTLHFFT